MILMLNSEECLRNNTSVDNDDVFFPTLWRSVYVFYPTIFQFTFYGRIIGCMELEVYINCFVPTRQKQNFITIGLH